MNWKLQYGTVYATCMPLLIMWTVDTCSTFRTAQWIAPECERLTGITWEQMYFISCLLLSNSPLLASFFFWIAIDTHRFRVVDQSSLLCSAILMRFSSSTCLINRKETLMCWGCRCATELRDFACWFGCDFLIPDHDVTTNAGRWVKAQEKGEPIWRVGYNAKQHRCWVPVGTIVFCGKTFGWHWRHPSLQTI